MTLEQPSVGAAVLHCELGQGTVAGYSKAYAVIHIRYENGDSASYSFPEAFERGILKLI